MWCLWRGFALEDGNRRANSKTRKLCLAAPPNLPEWGKENTEGSRVCVLFYARTWCLESPQFPRKETQGTPENPTVILSLPRPKKAATTRCRPPPPLHTTA